MRIFIGTVEVCQWIRLLSTELRSQGHSVISYAEKEPFFSYNEYTLRPSSLIHDFFIYLTGSKVSGTSLNFLFRALNKSLKTLAGKPIDEFVKKKIRNYIYKNTDVYIQIWTGLTTDDQDLPQFKKNGAKIISWFVGSDIRDYNVFKKQFKMDFFNIPEQYQSHLQRKLLKLRTHELYSDAIYSVPDQSSLALRPYFHLQIPLEVSRYKFQLSTNRIPVVVHIPSNPKVKGSRVIEKAIRTLLDEGLQFEYVSKSKIPHTEVIALLAGADILIDELILHGPGVLAFEAMLSGCAVATRYYLQSPACFRPPVVPLDENNIVDNIRKLVVDHAYRRSLILEGRKYAEEHNNVKAVAQHLINSLSSEKYDYYPSYFRDEFVPNSDADARVCNETTEMIKGENWYLSSVKSGTRGNLNF